MRRTPSPGFLFDVTAPLGIPLMVTRGFSSESIVQAIAEETLGRRSAAHHPLRQRPRSVRRPDADGRHPAHPVLRTKAEVHFAGSPSPASRSTRIRTTDTADEARQEHHAANFEGESVEVDAMPPAVLKQLLTDAIEEYMDLDAAARPSRGRSERARAAAAFRKEGGMMSSRPQCPLTFPNQADLDRFLRAGISAAITGITGSGYGRDGVRSGRWPFRSGRFRATLVRHRGVRRRRHRILERSPSLPAGPAERSRSAKISSTTPAPIVSTAPSTSLPIRSTGCRRDATASSFCLTKWPMAFDRLRDCPRIAVGRATAFNLSALDEAFANSGAIRVGGRAEASRHEPAHLHTDRPVHG